MHYITSVYVQKLKQRKTAHKDSIQAALKDTIRYLNWYLMKYINNNTIQA